ncbi:MAG: hypothetical protein Hyperionvirus17_9 [Hyperionvirus sp.]|uniref:Uncharacterized protein n=1 Tax=Hyperionvirus sp. TaxID=2487770 RepID=A0A3G5AFD8_9VIRU|nr:MAG: hypothetical protein Hyperionvirus17_9 [Hyperionvirus sp.]
MADNRDESKEGLDPLPPPYYSDARTLIPYTPPAPLILPPLIIKPPIPDTPPANVPWTKTALYHHMRTELLKLKETENFDQRTSTILFGNLSNRSHAMTMMDTPLTELPKILLEYKWLKVLKLRSLTNLESIANLPNVEILVISQCHLSSIKEDLIPRTVTRLDLSDNMLTCVDFGALPQNISHLDMSDNMISDILNSEQLPKLEILIISKNRLTEIPSFSKSLVKLDVRQNRLKTLRGIHDSITDLDCSHNQIANTYELPRSLIKLKACHNELTTFVCMPMTLKTAAVSNNAITFVEPHLPPGLLELDISWNKLSNLPLFDIPKTLEKLNISHNKNISQLTLREIHDKLKFVNTLLPGLDDASHGSIYHHDSGDDKFSHMGSGYRMGSSNGSYSPPPSWSPHGGYSHGQSYGPHGHHILNYKQWNQNRYNNIMRSSGSGYDFTPKSKHSSSNPHYVLHKRVVKV